MTFIIQQLSWHKRRKATVEPQPVAISVPDFEKVLNHFCTVEVTFDNGEVAKLTGRVTQHPITGVWSVNGINAKGQSVSARYQDDNNDDSV
ncbi:hypothetical protein [Pseudidiomarina terrestris]|uniref:Uncharacterized protein n=1 Tax=Pseudidiomarina terrestris TaxID=2820060 RepID=A0AAW7R1P0_9GAMM|nr:MULTISPECIES: hypothetical protein [unclassified Pseudidiomarina]MDN7125184.1 hypothetical protein [Pseudidiomarina sp. 1APP75-32.1]MDN7127413.1 hypothetical protein [Pseudidiomarina sp. 1APR75-33.1]MDN7129945.1 hypothetical protein [Pseudidiomarina sp. 1APR75-15]MDN7136111.1 hypothetical protein [Pseudidiomarina sp. 1ASP75-5]MDN7138364.1 hypothetical protein [Pseudidiomarina sp. 1ASP75-14]